MKYLVITDKNKQTKEYMVVGITSDDKGYHVTNKAVMKSEAIVQINNLKEYNLVNFGVENGRVVECAGRLERLKAEKGVQPCIVLDMLVSETDVILGYCVYNPASGKIFPIKKENVLLQQSKVDVPILQNAIVKSNMVNCYPNKPFHKVVIGKRVTKQVEKVEPKVDKREAEKEDTNVFSKEQLAEIQRARKQRVGYQYLLNPKLSPEQMRVLWVAKSKGALSEYFAKPEYDVEVMKFYADRLIDEKIVRACTDLLSNTKYKVEQLVELYLAICNGVDYTPFMDLDAENMYVQRKLAEQDFWGTEEVNEQDIVNVAVRGFVHKYGKKKREN